MRELWDFVCGFAISRKEAQTDESGRYRLIALEILRRRCRPPKCSYEQRNSPVCLVGSIDLAYFVTLPVPSQRNQVLQVLFVLVHAWF